MKVERDSSFGNDGLKRRPEVANHHPRRAQEWTQTAHVDGGAFFEQPQERRPVKAGPDGPESDFERKPVLTRERNSQEERTQGFEHARTTTQTEWQTGPGKANYPELGFPNAAPAKAWKTRGLALSPILPVNL